MAEYIKRKKVYEMLNTLGGCDAEPESWSDGWDKAIDAAIEELDKIPAANVRSERHGHWIYQEPDDEFSWKPYLCSACGEKGGKNYTEFCPHCGAKMDGKDV